MEPTASLSTRKWRRRCVGLAITWLAATILLAFPVIRSCLVLPLYVHQPNAAGDAAYVMADGHAYWERLHAASDLYNRRQVSRIMILAEDEPAGFNFTSGQVDTRVQRAMDHLEHFGVPRASVDTIPVDSSTTFGSLSEARGVARLHPNLKRIVVVTSAPHTRRSRLCFQRTLPTTVSVQVYSASIPQDSAELAAPIWMEYIKLVVYFFLA